MTASSLGLVTSVPLTRVGLDAGRIGRHVDASSWLALVVVAATAGVFAVAGSEIVGRVLGSSYGEGVGSQIGRLVVSFAPFMVVAVAQSVTFPVMFVAQRAGRLPLVALLVILVHVPLAIVARAVAGLWGLSIALAVSTAIALTCMLVLLRALRPTVAGIAPAAAAVLVLAAVSFIPASLILGPAGAGVVGVAVYGILLSVLRPPGLRRSWAYLRALA